MTLVYVTIVILVVTQRFVVEMDCVTIQIKVLHLLSTRKKAIYCEGLLINKEHKINLVKIIILNCPQLVYLSSLRLGYT